MRHQGYKSLCFASALATHVHAAKQSCAGGGAAGVLFEPVGTMATARILERPAPVQQQQPSINMANERHG